MLELSGVGSVLRGLGVLYWLLAIGAVSLALWKGKGRLYKAIWTTVAVAVFGFLPVKGLVEQRERDAFAREAWAYFKKKCDTEAGEKIYKTFTGVKSVVVVKPLPSATEKDLYDQFWYGDPYSASAGPYRAQLANTFLRDISFTHGHTKGFDFVESKTETSQGVAFERIAPSPTDPKRENTSTAISVPVSQFGVAWEDISTPSDRRHWVAGSRLRVLDVRDNSVVAERVGFLIEPGFGGTAGQRRPWLAARGPNTTCPSIVNGTYEDRQFVLKVLRPEVRHGQ